MRRQGGAILDLQVVHGYKYFTLIHFCPSDDWSTQSKCWEGILSPEIASEVILGQKQLYSSSCMARRALHPIFSCPYREHAPTPCHIVFHAYACIHAHSCNPPSENSGYSPVLLSFSLSFLLSYSLLLRFSFPSLCLTHTHTHLQKWMITHKNCHSWAFSPLDVLNVYIFPVFLW